MNIIKKNSFRYCFCAIIFTFTIFFNNVFAKPNIKIANIAKDTVVNPGQTIEVIIDAVDGFVIREGSVSLAKTMFDEYGNTRQKFVSLPINLSVTIPNEAAGTVFVFVVGTDVTGKRGLDVTTFKVEQIAFLQSLKINDEEISAELDWGNRIKYFYPNSIWQVHGVYSDGVERDIKQAGLPITYTSSDPSVISINDKGEFQVHKQGQAQITVGCEGITKVIPVVFREPTGLRPSELIPPTTAIIIQPQPNSLGWYNRDLTIALSAQDGSGIQEVDWRFAGEAKGEYKNGDNATVQYSIEGIKTFSYWSRDKEGNEDDNKIEIKLDKTLPTVTIAANPSILWPPNNKMVDVKITGEASDGLSGIDSLIFKVIDEYGKIQPAISQFGDTIKLEASREGKDKDGRVYTISVIAKDKAGNGSTAQITVTCPHDQGKK